MGLKDDIKDDPFGFAAMVVVCSVLALVGLYAFIFLIS